MAVIFTILLGLSALLLGYFLYDFGQRNFLRETEAAIDSEIEHILIVLNEDYSPKHIARYIDQRTRQKTNPVYYYQDYQGKRLAGKLLTMPEHVKRIKEGIVSFQLQRDQQSILYAAKIYTFEDGSQLLVGRDINEINAGYERLKLFSAFIMLFMLMVILGSFFISTFVVSRINMIAKTAQTIMETGDLSQRISINSRWDDLSNLAQILNELLARIETLMYGIRDVSDNIAHDLRTPLTRLRNDLEDFKHHPQQHNADRLIQEADQILTTFNSLLRISNIEKSARHQKFEPLNLSEILLDVIDLYDPLAEAKELQLTVSILPNAQISGDRDLLFQAFANLLDNAIKFSPHGKTITISLQNHQQHLEMILADKGCGISAQDSSRVFERFFRADQSRSQPGSGLGLSLVKAILDLHQTTILMEDNDPGLRVRIIFKH
ncbi:sensor histidine kinase [Gynuella sunshinyii]|uniref:histidine kinase n=1 Tax=Gynuella sunshinyii YC6258 TaxID=1445510 RepID=A0A0C5VNP9_9GAMM|nr:HAMP domain-containing sensor histidine kinase [Gynuella sunshinyii]AJQ95028.1 signal transduction histidine kinase [Gynuella sunshinyii YC6258]